MVSYAYAKVLIRGLILRNRLEKFDRVNVDATDPSGVSVALLPALVSVLALAAELMALKALIF